VNSAVRAAEEVCGRLAVLVERLEVLIELSGGPSVLVGLAAQRVERAGMLLQRVPAGKAEERRAVSVNSASWLSAALPSPMHHGQNESFSSWTAYTGPV